MEQEKFLLNRKKARSIYICIYVLYKDIPMVGYPWVKQGIREGRFTFYYTALYYLNCHP